MEIREMRGADLHGAVEAWHAANVARGQPPDEARVGRVREKLIAPAAQSYVAVRGRRVVGMLLAEPGRTEDGAGEPVPGLLHVSMVFVHPTVQRQGVGTALLRHLLARAAERGATEVGLWTDATNTAARALYERVGMVPTRERQVSPTRRWIRHERRP